MRKICLISYDNLDFFKSVASYFYSIGDVKLTCLFENKKLITDNSLLTFKNLTSKCLSKEEIFDYIRSNKFDICAFDSFFFSDIETLSGNSNLLFLFKALYPAFSESVNPVADAYKSGVKVSGITIFVQNDTQHKTIVAQYPLLISNLMHFDEYQKNVDNLVNLIYPIVIDKVSSGKTFDFQDLIPSNSKNKSCSNSCGSCQKCNH